MEDTFVVPSAWRRFVVPRHGDPGVKPWRTDPAARGGLRQVVDANLRFLRDVFSREGTDEAIRDAGLAHLAGSPDPLGAAAVASLAMRGLDWPVPERPRIVADHWLTEFDPAFAARAAVELNTLSRTDNPRPGGGVWRFTRLLPGAVRFDHAPHDERAAVAQHVRTALAALPDAGYAACVGSLAAYRKGSVGQRTCASYLVPTQIAWHADDCALVAGTADRFGAALLLMSVTTAADVEVLRPFVGDASQAAYPHLVYTAAASAGPAVTPVLVDWYDAGSLLAADRRRLLAILAVLPSDEAFQALLDRAQRKEVAPVLADAARRWPARALRILAASDRVDLLRAHVASFPDLVDDVLPPDAASRVAPYRVPASPVPAAVPAVLATPPWTVRRPPRRASAVVASRPEPATMAWLPGERDEWLARDRYRSTLYARDNWTTETGRLQAGRMTAWEEARFFALAPEAVGRPLVGQWRPARLRGDEVWHYVLVARYELDALPVALDAARKAPLFGAPTLLPYAAPELALQMADWSLRLGSMPPVAVAWLTRHAAVAARALIPPARSAAAPDRRRAERGLRLLADNGHRATVDEAARAFGAAVSTAIADLLDVDPLELFPTRIPVVPAWANPAVLPPVGLRDGGVLPPDAVRHLLTMLAMSTPAEPYAGLAIVSKTCDPADLLDFAEALVGCWEAAGSPKKESWVKDAATLLD